MTNLIFPYETLESKLQFAVRKASLVSQSGTKSIEKDIDLAINSDAKSINICHVEDKNWRTLRLDILISGTREELEPLFQAHGALSCTVSAGCRMSNLRQAVVLQRTETNRYAWEGIVEINRADVFGLIKLNGKVSGTAKGRNHRYLAETEEWTIYLDEAYMPQISGSLKVRWVNFASDQTFGDLRRFATEPCYVNLELPIPELYLNKELLGLPEIFADQIKPGPRRAVHETLRAGIAKSAWLALFQTSIEGIVTGEEGEEPSMPESDWQVSVLRQILPKIYPGFTSEAALREVVEERSSSGTSRIDSQAIAVIGKDIIREGKAVRTAISDLEIEFGGEE